MNRRFLFQLGWTTLLLVISLILNVKFFTKILNEERSTSYDLSSEYLNTRFSEFKGEGYNSENVIDIAMTLYERAIYYIEEDVPNTSTQSETSVKELMRVNNLVATRSNVVPYVEEVKMVTDYINQFVYENEELCKYVKRRLDRAISSGLSYDDKSIWYDVTGDFVAQEFLHYDKDQEYVDE